MYVLFDRISLGPNEYQAWTSIIKQKQLEQIFEHIRAI